MNNKQEIGVITRPAIHYARLQIVTAVRIETNREGMYRINRSDLSTYL